MVMQTLYPWPSFPHNLKKELAKSFSLQFILSTLTEAFSTISTLQKEIPTFLLGKDLSLEILELQKHFQRIYVFCSSTSLAQKPGTINKLCYFTQMLYESTSSLKMEPMFLIEEMRKELFTFYSKILMWKKKKNGYPLSEMLECLFSLFRYLFDHLRQFFYTLVPTFQESKEDENLIVYLIEHREELNNNLKPRCIEEVLQALFPKGTQELTEMIFKKYQQRGFGSQFCKVKLLIDAIKWECPCQEKVLI